MLGFFGLLEEGVGWLSHVEGHLPGALRSIVAAVAVVVAVCVWGVGICPPAAAIPTSFVVGISCGL